MMGSKKENCRHCCICGSSPNNDPTVSIHRFPSPGKQNGLRCEIWAKYAFPNENWSDPKFHAKIFAQHKMLCSKHFRTTCFVEKKLFRTATPDVPYLLKTNNKVTQNQSIDYRSDKEDDINLDFSDHIDTLPYTKPSASMETEAIFPVQTQAEKIIGSVEENNENENAKFGQHIANKLNKYDSSTYTQAKLKIMKILNECDKEMKRKSSQKKYVTSNPTVIQKKLTAQEIYKELLKYAVENDAEISCLTPTIISER